MNESDEISNDDLLASSNYYDELKTKSHISQKIVDSYFKFFKKTPPSNVVNSVMQIWATTLGYDLDSIIINQGLKQMGCENQIKTAIKFITNDNKEFDLIQDAKNHSEKLKIQYELMNINSQLDSFDLEEISNYIQTNFKRKK